MRTAAEANAGIEAQDATWRPVPLARLMAVFVLAFVVRLPVLALPLEGDGALLATRGALMGHEISFSLDEVADRGPLLPMLLAVPTGGSLDGTSALRWVDVLLGAFAAALAAAVAARLGLARREATWVGLLAAVHPLLAVHAGGALAGTASLVLVIWLLGLLLVGSPRCGARRTGAVLGALLVLADPPSIVFGVGLLVLWVARESSLRARIILVGLFVLVLVFAPLPEADAGTHVGTRMLAFGVQWVPSAALLALLPFVGRGARGFFGRDRPLALAWALCGGVYLLLLLAFPLGGGLAFGWDAGGAATPLVPLVLILGLRGLGGAIAPGAKRVRAAALVLAVGSSVFAVVGPIQTFVSPTNPPAAGRLYRLGRAVDAANEAAGPDGWVGLDVDQRLAPLEIERLLDRVPGKTAGRLPRSGGTADHAGLLGVADLPAGTPLGVLTVWRPEVLGVATYGGGGIYEQEPVARFGPWLVLCARRP